MSDGRCDVIAIVPHIYTLYTMAYSVSVNTVNNIKWILLGVGTGVVSGEV